jgi:hypothetical protein
MTFFYTPHQPLVSKSLPQGGGKSGNQDRPTLTISNQTAQSRDGNDSMKLNRELIYLVPDESTGETDRGDCRD